MSRKGQIQDGKRGRPKVDWKALEVVHADAAGIDIGGSEHWVAISPEGTGDRYYASIASQRIWNRWQIG